MKMNVLVLGSGGREHAITWAISRSPDVGKIFCAPGNPGMGKLATLLPLSLEDHDGVMKAVRAHRIDLTVVGPEVPLAAGVVDEFQKNGMLIFGPTRDASELEWSKSFAKAFMARHAIPTAAYKVFTAQQEAEAGQYVHQCAPPYVVKADGLAAGKGVVICPTEPEARQVIHEFLAGSVVGNAGATVVVEEFLTGEEASVFAVSDGERYMLLAPAQDHKRALDGDLGNNTGGMGAYAPAPCVTPAILKRVEQEVIMPTLRGMTAEGRPYRGCLYVGLMLTSSGPKVVEYNCRFGDPETQVVLPIYDGNFLTLLAESSAGRLSEGTLRKSWTSSSSAAVCVVLASGGYPGKYASGFPIEGLDLINRRDGLLVFHAGTALKGDCIVTAGGRVLGITAIEPTGNLRGAIEAAYRAIGDISFSGMHFRKDIGARGLRWSR